MWKKSKDNIPVEVVINMSKRDKKSTWIKLINNFNRITKDDR